MERIRRWRERGGKVKRRKSNGRLWKGEKEIGGKKPTRGRKEEMEKRRTGGGS